MMQCIDFQGSINIFFAYTILSVKNHETNTDQIIHIFFRERDKYELFAFHIYRQIINATVLLVGKFALDYFVN